MRAVVEALTRGCLLVALLIFAGGVQAQQTLPARADIVGCAKAVDVLDGTMRAPMQNKCLVMAIALCEGPESGPALACFQDLASALRADAMQLEDRLSVASPRDASNTLCRARYAAGINRTRCTVVAEFGHLRDLFNTARAEGVQLP